MGWIRGRVKRLGLGKGGFRCMWFWIGCIYSILGCIKTARGLVGVPWVWYCNGCSAVGYMHTRGNGILGRRYVHRDELGWVLVEHWSRDRQCVSYPLTFV
jgi:hypothetical protein